MPLQSCTPINATRRNPVTVLLLLRVTELQERINTLLLQLPSKIPMVVAVLRLQDKKVVLKFQDKGQQLIVLKFQDKDKVLFVLNFQDMYKGKLQVVLSFQDRSKLLQQTVATVAVVKLELHFPYHPIVWLLLKLMTTNQIEKGKPKTQIQDHLLIAQRKPGSSDKHSKSYRW